MKLYSYLIIWILMSSCLSPFDNHTPTHSSELISLVQEISDSLYVRGIVTDSKHIDISLDPGLKKAEKAKGLYNPISKRITIDSGWFERMILINRNDVLATITHEIGHSLGLKHVPNDLNHIMSYEHPDMRGERTMTIVYDELAKMYLE